MSTSIELIEARLRWFGHVERRDGGYIGPHRRFMDAMKEDWPDRRRMLEKGRY